MFEGEASREPQAAQLPELQQPGHRRPLSLLAATDALEGLVKNKRSLLIFSALLLPAALLLYFGEESAAARFALLFLGVAGGAFLASHYPAGRKPSTESEKQESRKLPSSAQNGASTAIDPEEYFKLKERYDLVTNNIAASVVISTLDGTVLLCSPYSQVLTGYSSAEIDALHREGKDFLENLVLEEDRERYRRARHVSRVGEDIIVRYRVRHRSGLTLWLETRMVPVVDEDGEVHSVMSVTIDVTDLLSYQEQIEEQNRDLNDFAYMVSHDLKAPIFTIRGMASAMMEDHGHCLEQDAIELLQYILDGAGRLEELVASVIEYSSVATKEGSKASVSLKRVIEEARADLQEQIKAKDAVLKVQIEDNPVVIGDNIRIYQVVSNLLGNALKYSSPERRPEITLKALRTDNETVIFTVADNGLGIPEGRLEDIFRPYHRAHGNEIEGSGIGLACVKKIVERMGGNVTVQSVENQGSTFAVHFPAPAEDPRAVPEDLARIF